MKSIALLGRDGGAAGTRDYRVGRASQTTARIQEAHKFIFHVICELVDPSLRVKS